MKRVLSVALAFCIMLSCFISADCLFVNANAAGVETAAVSASTGPQSQIQGSAVLHCFNWSYNSIKNNLQAIKDAGYTAVQTSPVQSPKDYNSSWRDQRGQWWKLYQPLDFNISNYTWLGNKSELKSLCDAAEKMGIKVIVDVVANHVANKQDGGGYGNINDGVASNLRRPEYYHDRYDWANDNSRYDMTMGHIGMPDLNTAHPDVQNIVKNFLIDCINQGVDGFRFDAAKHIELPTDDGNRSDFWPTVINGSQAATQNQIYYYGEILNGCGTDIGNFTKYMSITDNNTGDSILVAANNRNASGLAYGNYNKGGAPDKSVLWVESHDTHMGESGSAGMTKTEYVSDDTIIRAWAMVGSRADSTALFFARPAGNMGDASSNTTYKSKAVAEVNKFKNYFAGQTEYLSSENSIAYNERGNSGVVLVNANGGSCSVNVTAKKMANGTYKDAVSGSTFTVSNGRISGNIGNTGVAVVYNPTNTPTPTQPTVAPTKPTEKPTEAPKKYLCGDVDLDKQVNIMDGTYTQLHLAKSFVLTGDALLAADVDLNSDVNIMDTTSIQLYLASKPVEGTYCGQYIYGSVEPTEPTIPVPVGNYIYFKNNNNWSTVNAYFWSDENNAMMSWPGQNMQSVANGVYMIELPAGATRVIFNNGGNEQTGDLNVEGVGKIYNNGSWSDFNGEIDDPKPVDGNFIYFKNNSNWGQVKAYYWSDSNTTMVEWPGQDMESVGNNVYRIELPADATKIIFNNGDNDKTGDLNIEGFNKIYDNGWNNYNG